MHQYMVTKAKTAYYMSYRSESRADIRHMDAKLESTRELVRAIYDESKDFHARLCSIEERNRK